MIIVYLNVYYTQISKIELKINFNLSKFSNKRDSINENYKYIAILIFFQGLKEKKIQIESISQS